jgi:hypothetical protein
LQAVAGRLEIVRLFNFYFQMVIGFLCSNCALQSAWVNMSLSSAGSLPHEANGGFHHALTPCVT